MRSGAFQAGLLFAALIMGTFVALEGENIGKEMGDAGFALVGERVITTSFEQAGEVIKGAGWLDRPIRIVTLQADPEEDDEPEAGSPESREARRKRLLELVNQPTLSRGEQMFVLQAMNDGIEI